MTTQHAAASPLATVATTLRSARSGLDRELVTLIVVAVVGAVILLAWSRGEPSGIRTADGRVFSGQALPVAQALRSDHQGRLVVHGYLMVSSAGEPVRLCAGRGEGSTCLGPSLVVDRLDHARVWHLERGCCDTGFWTTYQLVLRGRVRDGHLTVAAGGDL